MQDGDGALEGTIRDPLPINQGHCAGTYDLGIHQPGTKAAERQKWPHHGVLYRTHGGGGGGAGGRSSESELMVWEGGGGKKWVKFNFRSQSEIITLLMTRGVYFIKFPPPSTWAT